MNTLVGSKSDVSERVGSSDDGNGSNRFGDSELVTAWGSEQMAAV